MNEITNDLPINHSNYQEVSVHVLIAILGELHTIRLQQNELIQLAQSDSARKKDPKLDTKAAAFYAGIYESCVDMAKKDLKKNFEA